MSSNKQVHIDKDYSFVSVPLILVLGTYSMITATHDGGGLAAVFARSVGGLTGGFFCQRRNDDAEFYPFCQR